MEDRVPNIIKLLQDKAVLNKSVLQAVSVAFQQMREITKGISFALNNHFVQTDKTVEIAYSEYGDYEFHLRFAGEILMFQMQTMVQTFGAEHLLINNPYVAADVKRGYFGSITVYNFLADSIRYNRINDAGYLLGRILLNHEGHFFLEGIRELNFQYPKIGDNVISSEILREFIQSGMLLAIETDLVAPAFSEIQIVALGDKLQDQIAGAAKVGFQINSKAKD
jgi:hypothetical protein